jgi:methylthioribose-1-phosphate isomerase
VDCVLVGADRIAANGDVANKIGTYGLAVLAAYHDVPFYVAAPLSTVDLLCPNGAAIPVEQRPAAEVALIGTQRIVPDGVEVDNRAFDVTPSALVTGIITDAGVVGPPYCDTLPSLAGVAPA